MDELERGSPFQQRDEEPSPQSDAEKSVPNEEPSPGPDNDEVDAGSQVMGRLPRTRPQRRSGRRPANAAQGKFQCNSETETVHAKPAAHICGRALFRIIRCARARDRDRLRRRPTETATRAAGAQARSRDSSAGGWSGVRCGETSAQGHRIGRPAGNEPDRPRTAPALNRLELRLPP